MKTKALMFCIGGMIIVVGFFLFGIGMAMLPSPACLQVISSEIPAAYFGVAGISLVGVGGVVLAISC